MVTNTESNQAEELSQCLDILNDGGDPRVEDEEIKELVDLAILVKHSYKQEELPRVLIDEVVENLAVELQAKKGKPSRYWLSRGFVATAAAVVIAAVAQFLLPQPADQNIAQHIDAPVEVQKIEDPLKTVEPKNAMIVQEVEPNNHTKEPAGIPIEEKATASLSQVIEEILTVTESPETEKKDQQVAILQEESPKDVTLRKNVFMAKTSRNSVQEDTKFQSEEKMTKMMVIPNQKIESIIVDADHGEVKQVYHDGLVIIQGLSDSSRTLQSLPQQTTDKINSLTTQVGKYMIRIEGKKTVEELKKIAESMIETEVEQ